jgi:hypothetical protein
MYCKQAPQVGVNLASIVHTATISYSQFEMLLSIAHLSAQIQSQLITLSTLHHHIIFQSVNKTLAQTLCHERIAKACLRVSFAIFIIFLICFSDIGAVFSIFYYL